MLDKSREQSDLAADFLEHFLDFRVCSPNNARMNLKKMLVMAVKIAPSSPLPTIMFGILLSFVRNHHKVIVHGVLSQILPHYF